MNKECECLMAGYCNRHKMVKGQKRFDKCKGADNSPDCGLSFWNAWESGELGATKPENPKFNPDGFCSTYIQKSNIGDKLSEVIKEKTGVDIPCEECKRDIQSLNGMTKEEATAIKKEMVSKISGRAYSNTNNIFYKIGISIDKYLNTGLLNRQIEGWFDLAVSSAIEVEPKKSKAAAKRANPAAVQNNAHQITPSSRPTSEQNNLFKSISKIKPIPKPFDGKPTFNLVWHFWPIKGSWEWHADRLLDLIPSINGKKIIGIAYDDTTDSPQDVINYFSRDDIVFIVNKNIKSNGDLNLSGEMFGELITAVPAFQKLADTGDSITIYGHAKGQRPHTRNSLAVKLWSEFMYETVSFNLEETIEKMQEGYDFIGSFRTFGFRPLTPKYKWHYSGTFYNFRTQSMFDSKGKIKPFQLKYGGTESWPGDHCSPNNAYCVFEDNSPWLRQYDDSLMKGIIHKQLDWESKRYKIGPKIEQHKREFEWFIDKIRGSSSLLVIGSRNGGLEYHIKRLLPEITNIVSVDINPTEENSYENLIIGSSHDAEVQNRLRSLGPYDAVFIDGDHSEDGTRLDWQFAKSLNPRSIFFHDHTDAIYHKMCDCHADIIWKEAVTEAYKNGWDVSEKVVGCGWGGIGHIKIK